MDKALPSFDDFYVVEGIRAYVCNVYALPQYIVYMYAPYLQETHKRGMRVRKSHVPA